VKNAASHLRAVFCWRWLAALGLLAVELILAETHYRRAMIFADFHFAEPAGCGWRRPCGFAGAVIPVGAMPRTACRMACGNSSRTHIFTARRDDTEKTPAAAGLPSGGSRGKAQWGTLENATPSSRRRGFVLDCCSA